MKETDVNEISQEEGQHRGNFEESLGPDEDGPKRNKTCCCDMFPKNRSSKVTASKLKSHSVPTLKTISSSQSNKQTLR